MTTPKKNTAYSFDLALVDVTGNAAFRINPTIVAGDFRVSIDNGALANILTPPTTLPGGSTIVNVNLTAAEMNGDKIVVQCIDAAGNEWGDTLVTLNTSVRTIDDLSDITPAEVNAEVVDALLVDTYAEPPQGVPPATTSLINKINYLYKFLRNRTTQTATTLSIYNDDAVTIDHKTTVSDDGTTATRNEIVAGP